MDSVIGNYEKKEQISIAIEAATQRNTSLPHMLFSGAAGCGKTSMARAVASTTGSPFLSVVPNNLKDLEGVLHTLDLLDHSSYDSRGNRTGKINPTILFLDEVHNLPIKGQEILGLVMERFMIEADKPDSYFWVPLFTVIGATTLAGSLSKPFRDRFKMVFNFQPYDDADMVSIVKYHVNRMGLKATLSAITNIALRSRGTPRIAVGYIERIRDASVAKAIPIVTEGFVCCCFETMGIDQEGLSKLELRILTTLYESKLPISLDNLSMILQEDARSIKDYAEPFLIRKGFLLISGRGRIITDKGRQHLKSSGKSLKLIKDEIPYDYVRK